MTTAVVKVRKKGKVIARLGRGDRSSFGLWFWEIDRVLLLIVAILISIGLISVAAASPASAERYSDGPVQFSSLYFFWKQLVWVFIGLPVMIGISMMPKDFARRFSLGMAAFFSVMLAATPFIGNVVNGSKRWIGLGALGFQPSEFLKPFFVVTLAWLLSLRAHDKDLPVIPISIALTGMIAFFLMMQPDFGQTVIFCILFSTMMMIIGVSGRVLSALAIGGAAILAAAYLFYPVATMRINNFIFATGDTYQVDSARATITAGGIFGTGPSGGAKKFNLPEAHTDYIYSVIGEEFGILACIMIAFIFVALLVRVFVRLLDEDDPFLVLACAGLATQFTAQAMINMSVNIGLAPSKGMTLPFISYGGSSLIALCAGFGLLLAFTRKNPYLKRSPYVVKWSGK